ncbi:TonB-dependent siderophore receptor [Campylobacter concisus]|jgi:tonB-dependent siderophore receptor|uniref:TonB-dependent siderophore receptor n=1 Tax=Campylobacter concisus TaxID=199 RepID=UPI000A00A099|nr:TonB-dependent siderophore receptor [Campylobacter concisus]ORI02783.1 ligand-gated channel protein [Campylobacter concisus]
MNKFRISAVLCFAISALNATDVSLDGISIEDSADDGYRATTSEVGKTNTPILEIPQTVNVVTQQQLKDKKPENLMESLQNVSGVSYANTTSGNFDAALKRGFGGGRDGSIMRNGVSAGVTHNFNATVQSVEVLKGPASLLYGVQDAGGIINLVTKKPLYENSNEIWLGTGNKKYRDFGFDSTGALGESGFAYRFIFDWSGKDYWREYGEYKNLLIAPSISYKGDDYRIDAAYSHTKYTDPADRGMYMLESGQILDIDKKVRLDEPFNEIDGKVDTFDLSFEKNFGENWLLKGAYAFSRSLHEYGQARIMNINLASGIAKRRMEWYEDFEHKTHAGSLTLNGIVETGSITHNLLFGVDAKEYLRQRPEARQIEANDARNNINIYSPIYGRVTADDIKSRGASKKTQYHKLKTIGTYAQDSINLTDSLIFVAGLRYEYYNQIVGDQNRYIARPLPFTKSIDKSGGKLLYNVGLLYLLTPEWSVYTSHSQSFKPQTSIGSKGAVSLEPEEGKSIEFGTKFQNNSITAMAALFNIDKKNIINNVNNISYTSGKANSRGVEFDFNGRITDGLSVSSSYTYTKTKLKEDRNMAWKVGKPLEATPKHQASLFANYDFTHLGVKGLRIGGGARYFGSWYTYNQQKNSAAYGNFYKLPHAITYDAFVSYTTKISGYETNFAFNVKNLTDKLYYVTASSGTDSSVLPITPGYARQFMLTASVKF